MMPATDTDTALRAAGSLLRLFTGRAWLAAASMAVLILTGVACGETATQASPGSRLEVVATTALLADLVESIGGKSTEVRSLIPPGADVHSFRPTPGDSIAIGRAAVLVSNGSGLDDFLDSVLVNARDSEAITVVVSEGLVAQPAMIIALSSGTIGSVVDDNRRDPHFWQNPLYVVHYVERIRDALVLADPPNAGLYRENASTYIQALRDLDRELAAELSTIPLERRHLITFHDAFGHFAERYGWKVSAFVRGDASDVTPKTIVRVMERVDEEGIPAIFAEPQFSGNVLSKTASDAGVVVGTLYSDSLDAQAPTYLDMMRFNARSLSRYLR